jgi:M6 family metalloprotease-like protein
VGAAPLAPAIAADDFLAAAYPSPLPNFAHGGTPHYPLYNPTNGRNDRPLLVIYETFTNDPMPPGKGRAWLFDRFFRVGFPSVRGYFRTASQGRMIFDPAFDTDGAGDGIVVINSGSYADWAARSSEANNRRALVKANPSVNYGSFDRNHDAILTIDELTIMKVEVHPKDGNGTWTGGGAATRGVNAGSTMDGVSLNQQQIGMANTATNQISIDHEVVHAAFGMPRDWYQFGIDRFDVMGGTITNTEDYYLPNAWNSMHLGWTYPTVVTRDGYYIVPPWQTGASFLLYDPDRGTQDYFLVENRVRMRDSYEQDVGDSGLNVWRIDESRYYEDPGSASPIKRIRPCEGSMCSSGWQNWAFDPSESATPAREMTSTWNDGTPANVAIRAMYGRANNMKVFFDVPGPGVLVDCFDPAARGDQRDFTVTAGEEVAIGLPVRNTGESAGEFDFIVDGLPAGWSATQDYGHPLEAAQVGATNITVRTPINAEYATTLNVTARSATDSSIVSGCTFRVRVRPSTVSGYVWANQPEADAYRPADQYQQNSTGAMNRVSRTAEGRYVVRFPGLNVLGGVVHATAYGDASRSCMVERWSPSKDGAAMLAPIRCVNRHGMPEDTRFNATFTRAGGTRPFAQLMAYDPLDPHYRVAEPYSFNSEGMANFVTRTARGSYQATLTWLAGATANVQVTPIAGKHATWCRVSDWGRNNDNAVADIRCTDAEGDPADSAFTLTFARSSGVTGMAGPAAHVRADRPSADYGPATQYNSTGAENVIEHRGEGTYAVTLPGLGAEAGHVQVTPMQMGMCHPRAWGPQGKAQVILVRCWNAAGDPADREFSLSYVR